jgi:hypothetical protein
MKKKAKRKIFNRTLNRSYVVPIVGDAAIAGPVIDGRMTPLLILDSLGHPEVDAIINAHSHLSPGDVTSNWASIKGRPDDLVLILSFVRPIEAEIAICFSIEKQAMLVDAVLQSGAVYLQAGKEGDRLIHDPVRPKVLVEVPAGDFNEKWEAIFTRQMTTMISREQRIESKEAMQIARILLNEIRKMTKFRMPQ